MPSKKGKPVEVDTVLEAEVVNASGGELGAFTMFGQEWTIERRPPALMISRMQRVQHDADALAILDQLIEHCLGSEQYGTFMAAYYAAAPANGDDSELFSELLGNVLQVSTGRPPA